MASALAVDPCMNTPASLRLPYNPPQMSKVAGLTTSRSAPRVGAELERRLRDSSDAREVAIVTTRAWRAVFVHLGPVIGVRELDCITARCVGGATGHYPWLADTSRTDGRLGCAELLEQALSGRSAAEAASAATLLFSTLEELLTSLVGNSLTQRLLLPVWTDSLREPVSQRQQA